MRKPLIGLLSVVALASVTPAAHAAFPGANGKIAFYTGQGTSDNIWVMQPDGSGLTQLTSLPNREWDPTWSPDGTKIALVVDQDIWTMNADGTNMVNLTNGQQGFSPSWSPDGSKIAFTATRANPGDFQSKIYVMNADGSDQHRITDGFTSDHSPAWSPDGRIAFVRSMRIFKMDADGSNPTQVTDEASSAYGPTWSPTGHRIAYTRSDSGPGITAGIHTINPDGTNDVDLSGALTEANNPAWSPDGSKLVVNRHGHVWTMNTDGTNPVQLTTTFGTNGLPDWQPLPFEGYARPRGASPMYLSLVPAYAPCTSPNRQHGPPLDFSSCTPSQTSPNLTVGTPDANGAAANSIGALQFTTPT
jgi:Tol biopolymer transport system component